MPAPQPEPNLPQLLDLALRHQHGGRWAEAESLYRQVLASTPNSPPPQNQAVLAATHINLGAILRASNRLDEAVAILRTAVQLAPNSAPAHNNLGNALRDALYLDEAVAAFRTAVRLDPGNASAHNNLGNTLKDMGSVDEAITCLRQALVIDPNWALAHYNLAIALLYKGEFPGGFKEYEWRNRAAEIGTLGEDFTQPRWQGEALNGRRILLHTEQGFGDAIQFARFIPQVIERGGKVIIRCQLELVRILRSIPGTEAVQSREQTLPPFDVHCPLLSLPLALNCTLQTLSAPVPYLRADPGLAKRWEARLPSERRLRRIGLAWAGRREHPNDRNRSIAPSMLAPLADAKDVWFCSLQKSAPAEAVGTGVVPFLSTDWTNELHDLADTAALVECLDLVISVDTAIAHLAGALGKPVWLLLPYSPDWRWMMNRIDSPWYPTMRLFRQSRPGVWNGPVGEIVRALQSNASS